MRDDDFYDDKDGRTTRILRIALPVLVFALIAGGIWYLLNDQSAVRRGRRRCRQY